MIPKLIRKTLLFASIWFVLIYLACLLLPFHYFNAEYPMWKSKLEILQSSDHHGNYILGDSRAIAGINPRELGDRYYNLALGGGTPLEGYFMLRKMIAAGKRIDTLVVSYAPLHLEQDEMFWERPVKFGFYTLPELREILGSLNPQQEVFWQYEDRDAYSPSEAAEWMKTAWLSHYRFPYQLRTELSKSFLLRGFTNYRVYRSIQDSRGCFDFGNAAASHDLNVEALRPAFHPKKVLTNMLESLFELAAENGTTVIYASMPMNESSYRALSGQYRHGVDRLLHELRTRHPEVRFVNEPVAWLSDEEFGDASHLNARGRTRFSRRLKQLIQDVPPENDVVLNIMY